MRAKTRNVLDIKPGMVIRLDFSNNAFRQVAAVKRGWWANHREITFTDGTTETYGPSSDFHVARGKAARCAARSRAGIIRPFALADVLGAVLGAYALAA